MNKELLYSITIPNYIRKVKLAEHRKTKYFGVGEEMPKKISDRLLSGKVIYKARANKKSYLYDTETEEFIIKNPRVAGTERWEVINGQKIYNGLYHPAVRAKIMEEIHQFLSPFLSGIVIDKFPLYIECQIHDLKKDPISKNQDFDAINRGYPYCKAFDDVLQSMKVIPDDNVNYVVCPSHPVFFAIDDKEDKTPKLVFNIYHIKENDF